MSHRSDGLAEKTDRALGYGRLCGVTDRQVDAVVTQIGKTIVGRNAEVYARMKLLEPAQARQQPQACEADACAEHDGPQDPGGLNLAHHVLQLLDCAVGTTEQPLTFRREGNRSIAAYQ